MNNARPPRIAAAIALLIGGLVHLQLYFEGYRSIDRIGPSFLLNAIASGLVAALLVARQEWFVRLAGVAVAVGTIGAFVLSRQGNGLFGFREQGLHPSPQATVALVVEIIAVLALAVTFLPRMTDAERPASTALLGVSALVSAAVLVGLGAYWSGHYDGASPGAAGKASAGGVQIADFAFGPPDLSVAAGTKVTWTNTDSVEHTVVAEDTSFLSENIGTGQTFAFEFDTPGQYKYVCGIHPQMHGTITVTG
ncbi:MAG: cupredoxin family copper-binding protein [Ilumatobacteraceae bacterium]